LSIVVPIILYLASALVTGGRLSIVMLGFYVALPYVINNAASNKKEIKRTSNKKGFLVIALLLVVNHVFIILTENRSVWIEVNPYMNDLMIKLTSINPAIYKNYTYLSSPIGVLNELLKDYEISFGSNTLLPLYSVLEKLGFNVPVEKYQ